MNANEREELEIFQDIFTSFPDLLKGIVKKHLTDLKEKRDTELMEMFEGEIAATLSAEICKEIDKGVIDAIMGQIDKNNVHFFYPQ